MSHPNQIPPKERIAGQIKPPFHASNGQVFCKIKSTGDQKLLDVRGWAFLTTSCKMTEDEACEYQDKLAEKIARILSEHWSEEKTEDRDSLDSLAKIRVENVRAKYGISKEPPPTLPCHICELEDSNPEYHTSICPLDIFYTKTKQLER